MYNYADDQRIFKQFIQEMNEVLVENKELDGRNQEMLLRALFSYEERFRVILTSSPEGRDLYKQFLRFILDDKGNILSARVYFRERQDMFSEKIAPAFHLEKPHLLYKFAINYPFARWAISKYNGTKKKSLTNVYNKMIEVRRLLCENNLPLAINRAKLFWMKIPNSHIEYTDIIQDATEGLLNAIDKFVPPYKEVFKSVVIGRMTLNMMTDHNATPIKFSSNDKRILYRANNAKIKEGHSDPEKVLGYVKEAFPAVTKQKLNDITSAATTLSSINDSFSDDDQSLDEILQDDSGNPEEKAMYNDLAIKINEIIEKMNPLMQKVVRLKLGNNSFLKE